MQRPLWQYGMRRFYAIAACVIFMCCPMLAILRNDPRLVALVFACFPFYAPGIALLPGLLAFPFDYSAFGKYRRTALPSQPPICQVDNSHAILGRLRLPAPFVSWLIYPAGLGIRATLFGDVFLPWTTIDCLESYGITTCMLCHHCAEVRSPIRVPIEVAERIAPILNRQRQEDIVTAEIVG